ncbi:MAG: peptidyl-prolyl cis-trans isomerase [Candidatus Acidiferrales bacterium]
MLKLFRQRKAAVRVLLFGIVGLVGFMMVVTLVPMGQADLSISDPQGFVARVGGEPLTQTEIQREYRRRVEQFGGDNPQFRKLILEGLIEDLIQQRAAAYEAARIGLTATPEEVRLQLRQFQVFYPGGRFVGAQTYQQILQREFNLTVPQFEEQVRRLVLLTKLSQWVTAGVTVSPAEVEQEYRRRQEQARIDYVAFRPENFARSLAPSDDDLRAYFERNRDRYQVPERRSVRFVAIDTAEVRRRVQLSPRELEDEYRRRIDTYRVPERVHARHILFLNPTNTAAGQPSENPARKQAEEALEKLHRGGDFTALARQHSAHAETREKGGDLGWLQRGQTVTALDQVLFSLPAGSPPRLVETGYGVHIVQVLEHEQERVRSLEEVRPQIESVLRQQKVEREAHELARRVADAVRGGKTLDAAAGEAGLTVRESPLFARDERLPAFGSSLDFQQAAFSLPAPGAGQPSARVSEPVEVPAGYAVLPVKEASPTHQAPFEDVRAEVERAFRQERAAELARDAAAKFASDAQARGDFRAAARAAGVEVAMPEKFSRLSAISGLTSSREVASLAFTLPVGAVSTPVSSGGTWVVFRLLERQEIKAGQMTPDEREAIQDLLLDQKRSLAWTVFATSLKKRLTTEGKLQVNDAAVKRLVGES